MIACRVARADDLSVCAELYRDGFARGLTALFGRLPHAALLRDYLSALRAGEAECIRVACLDGRVVGYIVAPRSLRRAMRRAAPRLVLGLLAGRYGVGSPPAIAHAVREALRFVSHAGDYRAAHRDDAQIVSIAVQPDARGRGVAHALVTEALAYLRASGAREVRLEVQPDNHEARRVYERLGFVERGSIPSVLGRAIVMTRALS